jgi:Tfp pilus assembly protein PilF
VTLAQEGVPEAEHLARVLAEGADLHNQGRHPEAQAIYGRVLAADPGHFKALLWLGLSCLQTARPDLARGYFERAVDADPRSAPARNELGMALNDLNRPQEALARFEQAITLGPALVPAHVNKGYTLHDLGRLDEAIESLDRALALQPDHVDAHVIRSLSLLRAGRFAEGWREFEWRKRKWDPQTHVFDPARFWAGDVALRGETLFVYSEQGLGDLVQFSRYLEFLPTDRGKVVVSAPDALIPLLRPMAPALEFQSQGQPPPEFDYHCAMMSLPLALAASVPAIPARTPYLRPDPTRRAAFAAQLGPKVRPRIGVAWSGNPAHAQDRFRSIPFETFAALTGAEADWIALQNAINPSDVDAFLAHGRVRAFGAELKDFADAAALVDLMDLVITVDTSLAHLAGALGKPVWILLAPNPDWRWMLNRPDTPWYPTARLIRQPRGAGWPPVIEAARADLRATLH